MKIPSFDLKISKLWAVIVIIWSILLVIITWYINHKINQYKIETQLSKNTESVSSLSGDLDERRYYVDGQLTGLRNDVNVVQKDVTEIKVKLEASQKNQDMISRQLDQVQVSLTSLTTALIKKDAVVLEGAKAKPVVYREVSY